MAFSESTKRILKEIRESSEGWHCLIEATDDEIIRFEEEFDSNYILEIEEESKGQYYIVLGTDWPIAEMKINIENKHPGLSVELIGQYSLNMTDSIFYAGEVCSLNNGQYRLSICTNGVVVGEIDGEYIEDKNYSGIFAKKLKSVGIETDEDLEYLISNPAGDRIYKNNCFTLRFYVKDKNNYRHIQIPHIDNRLFDSFNFVEDIEEFVHIFLYSIQLINKEKTL